MRRRTTSTGSSPSASGSCSRRPRRPRSWSCPSTRSRPSTGCGTSCCSAARFHEAGVPSAKFYEVKSLEDVDAALEVVPLPAVLKPQAGAGSILTFEATDKRGADRGAARRARARGADLDGRGGRAGLHPRGGADRHRLARRSPLRRLRSCESLIFQGEVHHINVTDRAPLAPPFRETGVIMPSTLDDDKQQQIKDVAEQAAKALRRDERRHAHRDEADQGRAAHHRGQRPLRRLVPRPLARGLRLRRDHPGGAGRARPAAGLRHQLPPLGRAPDPAGARGDHHRGPRARRGRARSPA